MSANTDTVARFFDALNRYDMPAMLEAFDADVVRVEFEGTPNGGTYRGIEALRAHIDQGRGTWAEGACTPAHWLEGGGKVVVYVHVRVRLKGATDWVEGRVADAFALRGGRITEFRSFMQSADALAWAGIDDTPPEEIAP